MIDESWQLAAIIVSFLSLGVTVGLFLLVIHLDRKQRQRDEKFYIISTIKDIRKLKKHLINIQNISEPDDPIPNQNEQIKIAQDLVNYGEENKELMESLMTDIKSSMSRWMNLKDSERENVENFIKTTNWVIRDYIPKSDEHEKTQIRKWSNYFEEFQKLKSKSSQEIDGLLSEYN